MASTVADCPACEGIGTIRRGVCFRCGFELGDPTFTDENWPIDEPAATAMPQTATNTPSVTSHPNGSQPVMPSYSSSQPLDPTSSKSGARTEGRITAMGVPRNEVVAVGLGDALARIAMFLAFAFTLVVLIRVLLPLIILFIILAVFISRLRVPIPSPWLFLLGWRRGPGIQNQEVEIPVAPLTVTTPDGRRLEVVLRGELRGGSLHLGDIISIQGRIARNRTIQAKSITNLVTGARTTTREHPALLRNRIKTILSLIVIVFICFWTYSLIRAYTI